MLNTKTRYLQIALNGSIKDANRIISQLPISDRILIEAGTPFIKRYGIQVITQIKNAARQKQIDQNIQSNIKIGGLLGTIIKQMSSNNQTITNNRTRINDPYIVADMKMMDRGSTEVQMATQAGANAVVALGLAPIESLNSFIQTCDQYGVDSMIDMMNVTQPYKILRKLKKLPKVIILHRGVDEEKFSDKPLPIHMINKIKGTFNLMISIAGGDTPREIQSAVFNGADIVVLWKNFYSYSSQTSQIAHNFLEKIK